MVPGLRALPQRYLRRGLQENLIGENAENLGDMIANPETKKSLNVRLDIAEQEIARHNEFDAVILNDDFEVACEEAKKVITNFITS